MMTIFWSSIETLTFKDTPKKGPHDGLYGHVVLRNGEQADLELQMCSRKKWAGNTELGEYAIDLENIRSIQPFLAEE